MSTALDRLAVETPRGQIRAGPIVAERTRTESNQLCREVLVDLGVARLWVPTDQYDGDD